MAESRNRRLTLAAISLIGVVIGVLARGPVVELLRGGKGDEPKPARVKLPPSPEELAKPHLSWADRECEAVIEEHLRSIESFFSDSKKNTRGFAEIALGWGSKWRLVTDYIPFTRGGRHEEFIREEFAKAIFKPTELEKVVSLVVASYMRHVESLEGQMLVRIRADAGDFPSTYLIARIDENRVKVSYDEAVSRAIEATGNDIRNKVTTEIISIIVGEVLTQVAIRLGASVTILSAGAASSWMTLGIGAIVGLIVDQIVSWIWDWYADPQGDLAAQLDAKLDEINRLIVDGADGVTGLRERLGQFARQRAAVRRQAVLSLLRSE